MNQILGRYHLLEELGRGGMGVVYKALDPKLERFIAIKCLNEQLSQDEIVVARFLREARNVAALNHPHIAQIHVVDEHEGRPYFVMEFVNGESLAQFIRREGQCSPEMARRITEQSAQALNAAAAENIVHRDIKPGNIMIDRTGRAVLTDFGIACIVTDADRNSRTKSVMGTPGYLPPEVLTGHRPDQRGDIFALGAVYFEMLTGRRLFEDTDLRKALGQTMSPGFPDLSALEGKVDPQVITILRRMLAPRPEDRYTNCDELLSAMAALKETDTGLDSSDSPTRSMTEAEMAGTTRSDATSATRTGIETTTATPTGDVHSRDTAPIPHKTLSRGKRNGLLVTAAVFISLIVLGIFRLEGQHLDQFAQLFSRSEQPPAPAQLPDDTEQMDRSIAVLPFESLGGDNDNPFVDGLHHDLLTRLSHIDDLRVISRTSVRRYQDTILSIRDIAGELGVAWIVEGAMQQAGDEIQLNVQLIDGQIDSHIWAHTYRRELTAENLFAIQAEIVDDIATSLAASLTPAEEDQVGNVPTENLDSYMLFARGRGFLEARTEDGMEQALVLFREAVEQDADYALAWIGLANALALLHDYGYRDADDVLPEAERAIERALALNPDLAEAHASRGLLYSTRRDGPEALRALNEATALRPGYAEAHNWLSWNYQVLGFASEALASAKKAVSLNPFSVEALANLTGALIANGQYEAALRQARHLDALPLPFIDNFNKGLALYHAGMFHETIATLEPMQVTWADGGVKTVRALAHIALNEEQQAEALLEELHEIGDHFSTGLVLAALGDREAAFAEFENIEQWHYWSALALNHYHPLIEPIRSDPRFEEILGDMREHYGLLRDGSLPSQ
jgi:serine/threonine protein kinase/tetratricopeptide (TPR) repeat protein